MSTINCYQSHNWSKCYLELILKVFTFGFHCNTNSKQNNGLQTTFSGPNMCLSRKIIKHMWSEISGLSRQQL